MALYFVRSGGLLDGDYKGGGTYYIKPTYKIGAGGYLWSSYAYYDNGYHTSIAYALAFDNDTRPSEKISNYTNGNQYHGYSLRCLAS